MYKAIFKAFVIVGVIVFFVGLAAYNDMKSEESSHPRAVAADPIETHPQRLKRWGIDPSQQAKRRKHIQELTQKRIILKSDAMGSKCWIEIGPAWPLLTFDQKQAFVSMVFAFYATDYDWVEWCEVRDSDNHKIGIFRPGRGLVMD